MRVTITAVERQGSPDLRVCFTCPIGSGFARWGGSRWEPRVGATFYVELDVEHPIRLGQNARRVAAQCGSISVNGDQIRLTGCVEQIDPDEVGYFRLAPQCLMLVELASEEAVDVDTWLELAVPIDAFSITAFDVKM